VLLTLGAPDRLLAAVGLEIRDPPDQRNHQPCDQQHRDGGADR